MGVDGKPSADHQQFNMNCTAKIFLLVTLATLVMPGRSQKEAETRDREKVQEGISAEGKETTTGTRPSCVGNKILKIEVTDQYMRKVFREKCKGKKKGNVVKTPSAMRNVALQLSVTNTTTLRV